MAITKFYMPEEVVTQLTSAKADVEKTVNAVQAEINKAVLKKSSTESKAKWVSVKDNGRTVQYIDIRTKAGEHLRAVNTIPAKFYAWCLTYDDMQSFATTPVNVPKVFIDWAESIGK